MNILRTLPSSGLRAGVLALVAAGLTGCKSDPSGKSAPSTAPATSPPAVVVNAPPPPLRSTPTASAPSGATTDRGNRLLPPRPIGALAPEVVPTVPK